jgi:predicted N-acyltransferase
MTTIHELDNELEYDAEISQCVAVTGYHRWFFLSALAEALKLEFRAFAVDLDGERLGVVPLLFRHRGPASTVNILPIGCIGPLIRGEALRAGLLRELVQGVDPVLRRHRTIAAKWAFPPGLNVDAECMAMPGFENDSSENYVISSAKSVEELLESMSRSRRQSINRHIRRGLERGVTIEEATTEEVTQWLPRQIGSVYERQGLAPLYDFTELCVLTERLAAHPGMLWRTAKVPDGNAVGMAGCVLGDDRVWGWLIAGSPVQGASVQTLCYWDLIKWSLARGLALDLGGAPNEGIRELKVSLGADEETVTALRRVRYKAFYNAVVAISLSMERRAKRSHSSSSPL